MVRQAEQQLFGAQAGASDAASGAFAQIRCPAKQPYNLRQLPHHTIAQRTAAELWSLPRIPAAQYHRPTPDPRPPEFETSAHSTLPRRRLAFTHRPTACAK